MSDNKKEDKQEFFSEEFFLEDEETQYTLAEAEGNKPAVIIHGFTKASKQWEKAKSKYKIKDQLKFSKDQEMIVDSDLTLGDKKALALLVTKITGLSKDDLTGDKVKDLFVNPRARKVVARWELHLNTMGNAQKGSDNT